MSFEAFITPAIVVPFLLFVWTRINARFDAVNARIDGLDSRIDGLSARIDGVARDMGYLARDAGYLTGRQAERDAAG